jgi:hypothetical protein
VGNFFFARPADRDDPVASVARRERDPPDFALMLSEEAITGFGDSGAGANKFSRGIKPQLFSIRKFNAVLQPVRQTF